MANDTKSVLCGACHVAVKGPADPKPEDTFTCPSCGRADSLENVMASAIAFVLETSRRYLQESMRETARGSKFIKFEGKPVPKSDHAFIVDLKL